MQVLQVGTDILHNRWHKFHPPVAGSFFRQIYLHIKKQNILTNTVTSLIMKIFIIFISLF